MLFASGRLPSYHGWGGLLWIMLALWVSTQGYIVRLSLVILEGKEWIPLQY